jgi:hypothetical protein
MESVERFIVTPGKVNPALPHPMQGGQQKMHWM